MKRPMYFQPQYLIFSIALLLMAFAARRYDHNVFVFEICVSVISAVLIIVFSIKYHKYVNNVVRSAVRSIKGVNHSYLEKFSVPVVIAGTKGDILWYNVKFKKKLAHNKDCTGDLISCFISNIDINTIIESSGIDVELDGRHYTVIASEISDGAVLYYIDDTDYKVAAKLYEDTRPVVATVNLDNRDDFERNNSDDDVNQAVVQVESILKKWALSYNGVYKKVSSISNRREVHYTLNARVESTGDGAGKWDSPKVMIVDSVDDNEWLNKDNTESDAPSDSWTKGKNIKLSSQAVILVREDALEELNLSPEDMKNHRVMIYSGNPTKCLQNFLTLNNYNKLSEQEYLNTILPKNIDNYMNFNHNLVYQNNGIILFRI